MQTFHKIVIADAEPTKHTVAGRFIGECHTAFQRGELCIWYAVDTHEPEEEIEVIVIGTGHKIPEGWNPADHAGSALTENGNFVWHVLVRGVENG